MYLYKVSLFYKYLPPERDDFFFKRLLRFTQIEDLNDAFECFPAVLEDSVDQWNMDLGELAKDALSSLFGDGRIPSIVKSVDRVIDGYPRDFDVAQARLREKILSAVNDTLGVFCLSSLWDNQLMWAHYTSSHHGFVIGLESNHDFFGDISWGRIQEDPEGDIFDFGESIPPLLTRVHYTNERPAVYLQDDELDWKYLITKPEEWKYESEYRLIRPLSMAKEVLEGDPFDIHLFEIPREIIKEVIFGVRMPEGVRSLILRDRWEHVEYFQAKVSTSRYAFERDPI